MPISTKKSITFLLCFLGVFFCLNVYSQSFSNNTVTPIKDNDSTFIPVTVEGLQNIDTTSFGLESVSINITHPKDSELTVFLQSPDGTRILLARSLPGSNFTNTFFNGTAASYVDFGSAPYTGIYRPIQDLSYLNNFQNANGIWRLVVKDGKVANAGNFQSVTLTFSNQPAKPLLSSSILPIVIINTNGQEILDDPKILADMSIIYNGPGAVNSINQTNYYYHGKIGIEIRGHGSQAFPKKQYGFETRDATGEDDEKVSLFGFPDESDWILSANYSDKTMMRNILAYQLSRDMGNYASRTKYCEVILNNEYRGVFVFQEKIKRDKGRVNVEKLSSTDITAPNITGGYIYSKDYVDGGEVTWTSKIPESPTVYQFVYPKSEDVVPEQKNYLQSYVDSFELALNGPDFQDAEIGFRKYADEASFMDYFIVEEVSKNIDGFRLSSYFNKSRLGKIKAGPVWDFDIAWGNAFYDEGSLTTGFSYAFNYVNPKVPFIWGKLMIDKSWKEKMTCRYNLLRQTTLSKERLYFLVDSLAGELNLAEQRNFTRWDIIGEEIWPNPTPVPTSFSEETQSLKLWISDRLDWLDIELGSPCGAPVAVSLLDFEGVKANNINKLTWSTSSEINNDYFIIERSTDGSSFTQAGKVEAKGQGGSTNNYSYNDPVTASGILFYRLRMVDMAGRDTYSKIIQLSDKKIGWHINLSKTDAMLTIYSPKPDGASIHLNFYSMNGQRVKSTDVKNEPVITQNIKGIGKGVFILEIVDKKGRLAAMRFLND